MSANLQDELLALLADEQAVSCCGLLPTRQQLSRRGNSQTARGDKSVPPTLKYWANTNPKCKHRREKPNKQKTDIGERLLRISLNARIPGLGLVQYFALIITGVCTFFFAKMASNSYDIHRVQARVNSLFLRRASDGAKVAVRAQFSFIDSVWRGIDEVQFETLIPPTEIDFATQRRVRVNDESNCDDILLFLPQTAANQENGIELNGYLLAAMLATYLGKAMVILDAPLAAKPEPGSWFDCPLDGYEKKAMHDKNNQSQRIGGISTGLSRLIQHPQWLSRGCPVPCQTSYDFLKWNELRHQHIQQVTCQNDNDRQAIVFTVGGEEAHQYFERQWKEQMLERPSVTAYDWALRLGAKGYEAQMFAKLQKEEDIWDYVAALMARSGIIRFQPWIARDIKSLIKATDLPLNWPYMAIYVYRGNIDERESRDVTPHMTSKEFETEENQLSIFIPFHDYLRQWESTVCNDKAHPVYIATNDPLGVQAEIDDLPKGSGGNTILEECHKMKFIFSPVKPLYLPDLDERTECVELHRSYIATLAELMILAKSDTFVGELNSNIGRLVRIFRTAVNNFPGRRHGRPVLIRNNKIAHGGNNPGLPRK